MKIIILKFFKFQTKSLLQTRKPAKAFSSDVVTVAQIQEFQCPFELSHLAHAPVVHMLAIGQIQVSQLAQIN